MAGLLIAPGQKGGEDDQREAENDFGHVLG